MGHGMGHGGQRLEFEDPMRTAALTITFEPKGVARLIRDAGERKEFRLKTPQGSVMERLVLEVLGGRRASWRTNYDVVKGLSLIHI